MLIVDLFLLKPSPYFHACESPRAPMWVTGFLFATGIILGVFLALFSKSIGTVAGVSVDQYATWKFFAVWMLAGIMITVLIHVGITMVSWLMAKAIGGPGLLIYLYRTTAYVLPLTIPALPRVAYSIASSGQQVNGRPLPLEDLYLPLAGLGLALFFIGLYQIFLVTQDKGPIRSALAVGFFALFCTALLLIS